MAEERSSPRQLVPRNACPLCGSAAVGPRFALSYSWQDSHSFVPPEYLSSEVTFAVFGCGDCGFRFTSPQPSESWLSELYGKTEDSYFTPLGEAAPDRQRLYRRVHALALRRGIDQGRVLDIGCGTGEALASWPDRFARHGVEPSRFAAERARAMARATVHVGDLETASFPAGFFDVVTAFDVLEHLPDPRRLVLEVGRVLRPGGVFFVETGDITSLNARLAAGHWYYVRLPGHLSFFSPRTLKRLLLETGYHAVESMRTHHGEVSAPLLAGHARAMARHLLARALGPRVLVPPLFRSRTMDYSIPFLWDHMLVVAAAGGGRTPP